MDNALVHLSPLEIFAYSLVRNANSTRADLILVLTRGGSTAKLVAKYRPGMPIPSVVVPDIETDYFDWSCSDESPARHSMIFRGLVLVLCVGSTRESGEYSTEEALDFILNVLKKVLCTVGDAIVALHRIYNLSVEEIQQLARENAKDIIAFFRTFEATHCSIGKHYETGESLPEDIYKKCLATMAFRDGSFSLREIKFTTLDIELHSKYIPGGSESIYDVDQRISERTQILPPLPEDRFLRKIILRKIIVVIEFERNSSNSCNA